MSDGTPSLPLLDNLDEGFAEIRHAPLFQIIMNILTEGVTVSDLTGRIIFSNAFAKQLFDTPDSISAEEWQEQFGFYRLDGKTLVPFEELPLVRALRGEEVRDMDLLIRHPKRPEGIISSATSMPLRNDQGQLLGTLTMTRDIDKERRSEAAKHRSEAKFRQVVETAQEGVWTLDIQGRTTYVNRFFADLLGYSIEEMLGRPVFSFLDEETQKATARKLETRSHGIAETYETRLLRKDGSTVWINLSASPLKDEQGQFIGTMGMISDITRRRSAEEEVRRLNAELERRIIERTAQLEFSNRELEAFAYTVAHDLRAPLRSIASFSDAILEDCPGQLDKTGQDYLKRIIAGAQRMDGLIAGILMLSRVNSTSLTMRECDLSAMARASIEQFQDQHRDRQVRLKIQDGLVDKGDPQLLRAVMENLLGNAWKFTRERPDAEIEFSATTDDRGARIYQVRDNGAGFDMTFSEKLFGVFQRLHTQQEFEGTGVGLATSQRIIRRHGGRIWGEGKPGHGACFSFTLHEFALPPGTAASLPKK